LGNAKNAVQIWTTSLNTVKISSSGDSATIGAGINGKKLTNALWANRKQTVTGFCECVGLTAVALGGGHGLLQGYHGLLSDQIISLRMVLANGSAITVSKTEHEDLFWGMRGAGHNFGVVTELEYKIYDVDLKNGKDVWSYEGFVFPATQENIRKIYTISKESMKTQPSSIFVYGLVLVVPDIGPEPVIMYNVAWNGPLSTITPYTQAFHDLGPSTVMKEEGTYLDVPRWMQIDDSGMVCNLDTFMPGGGVVRFPVDVPEYNVDALTEAVQRFTEIITSEKALSGSFLMIEQYATAAVTKQDSKASSFPWRHQLLLVSVGSYQPSPASVACKSLLTSEQGTCFRLYRAGTWEAERGPGRSCVQVRTRSQGYSGRWCEQTWPGRSICQLRKRRRKLGSYIRGALET
jgi:hypothetical protein